MHKLVFVELFSRDTAIVLQLLRLSNHRALPDVLRDISAGDKRAFARRSMLKLLSQAEEFLQGLSRWRQVPLRVSINSLKQPFDSVALHDTSIEFQA